MRFVYADPPYLGKSSFGAAHHYGHQHERAADYDTVDAHRALLERIKADAPDGFAVSLGTPSLEEYAHLCREVFGPNVVRFGAWVKPFASFKRGVNPAYVWEPVVFVPGPRKRDRKELTVRDFISANITTKKGTSGAKPDGFSFWLFDLLGMTAQDELQDWFPGSGAVARAWKEWRFQRGAA